MAVNNSEATSIFNREMDLAYLGKKTVQEADQRDPDVARALEAHVRRVEKDDERAPRVRRVRQRLNLLRRAVFNQIEVGDCQVLDWRAVSRRMDVEADLRVMLLGARRRRKREERNQRKTRTRTHGSRTAGAGLASVNPKPQIPKPKSQALS